MTQSFESLSDPRTGANTIYEVKDAAVSAFGVFFTQSSSFLGYQRMIEKAKGKSNVQSLFGAERIPSDAQVRNLLDEQSPELLYGVFEKGHELLVASGKMARFRSYEGQVLISCDGTGTISSQKIHCANCSRQEMANGETLYTHNAILPVIVKTGETGCWYWNQNLSALKMGMRSKIAKGQPSSVGSSAMEHTLQTTNIRCSVMIYMPASRFVTCFWRKTSTLSWYASQIRMWHCMNR